MGTLCRSPPLTELPPGRPAGAQSRPRRVRGGSLAANRAGAGSFGVRGNREQLN